MKIYKLSDLKETDQGHILYGILPGKYILTGGLSFLKPGERSHSKDGGTGYHIHEDCEAFIIIQGKGSIEIDKKSDPIKTGDIIIVEPGEDHHIISSTDNPIVTLWCHAGACKNENQI